MSSGSPRAIDTPRLTIGQASKRLAGACLDAETGRTRCLGVPSALMGELVQHLRELIARHDLRAAILRNLLKRGSELLAGLDAARHVMCKLVECGGDLLLLCRNLLRLAKLLAKNVLAAKSTALSERTLSDLALSKLTLSKLTLSELTLPQRTLAEWLANSLGSAIAARHPCRSEDGRRQCLGEKRCVIPVGQKFLHWASPNA
jgi:hypothetical protein